MLEILTTELVAEILASLVTAIAFAFFALMVARAILFRQTTVGKTVTVAEAYSIGTEVLSRHSGCAGIITERMGEFDGKLCYRVKFPELGDFEMPMSHEDVMLAETEPTERTA